MAFKIYKKNNYIIVEDTISGKQYQGLAKNVFVYKDAVAETTYDFEGLTYNGLKGISLNDLVDETDTAFVNEQAFIDFYTENTGNFNEGGGSPQLTANELLGIQNANDLNEINPVATINDTLDVYSETETVVGTWIDDKPIYQKTIKILNADLPVYDLILADYFDDIEEVCPNSSLFTDWTGENSQKFYGFVGDGISAFLNTQKLSYFQLYDLSAYNINLFDSVTLTLNYTKTTD